MSETTLTGQTWVAIGPTGVVGSIHRTEGGFSVRSGRDTEARGQYATLEAAKSAVMATLPPGSERPEFTEH